MVHYDSWTSLLFEWLRLSDLKDHLILVDRFLQIILRPITIQSQGRSTFANITITQHLIWWCQVTVKVFESWLKGTFSCRIRSITLVWMSFKFLNWVVVAVAISFSPRECPVFYRPRLAQLLTLLQWLPSWSMRIIIQKFTGEFLGARRWWDRQ